MIDVQKMTNLVVEMAIEYGPKLLGAILLWIIGLWVIKMIIKGVDRIFKSNAVDQSLAPFLKGIISMGLKIMLVLSVMNVLGIAMTSFVAILGAVGLAVGMALSGTLQNFAGGVIILIFKPFKPGDFIEAQGYQGIVKEVQIFNTIISTLDNKSIILPNGALSTSSMVNYSTEDKRRVDWTFGIGYGDDIDQAKTVLLALCHEDERIINDPEAPFVAVSALADSSVNFVVRAWVKPENYWPVFFDMNEKVYKKFNQENINIPFPQMDVHLHQNG